ncbi:MAG TPA: hypothetical protein PK816_09055 [Candidatus Cloacimonadota bacterium]|nr:hypothetical protein [Candidatus Cloacimonadota bacterium]
MKRQFNNRLNRELLVFDKNGINYKIPRFLKNDRYEVIDLLAVGGIGIILIAKDKKLYDKKVLIKRAIYKPILFKNRNDADRTDTIETIRESINTEYAAMLHGWARGIPSIPVPLDLFTDINPEIFGPHITDKDETFCIEDDYYKEEPYLVVNYFTGGPLTSEHYILNNNRIGFVEFYIKTIANILTRFHTIYESQGVKFHFYYCDLKPSNTIYTDDKQLVLIDMGSFAIMVNDQLHNKITTTPGYSAPEIAEDQSMYLSPAVDVYALAMSAFELITGKGPVLDLNKRVIHDWNIFEDITLKANAKHWPDVFRKALQDNPDNRYQSLQEFVSELCLNKNVNFNPCKYRIETDQNLIPISGTWFANNSDIDREQRYKKNIIAFNVIRKERFFDLSGQCSNVNMSNQLGNVESGLRDSLFYKSRVNLIQNYTFLPELIEISANESLISYQSPQNYISQYFMKALKTDLKKMVEFFIMLQSKKYKILGIAPNSIQFDKLKNPFINDFWILLNQENETFLENPLLQNVLGNRYMICPEVKQNNKWVENKSFSYYAGITMLLMINKQKIQELYHSGQLFEKIHYERFIHSLETDDEMKDILLNLITHNPEARISIFEARQKLTYQRFNPTNTTKATKRTLQIQFTESSKEYIVQYYEIYKSANIRFSNVDKNVFFSKTPPDLVIQKMKENNIKTHTYDLKTFSSQLGKLMKDYLRKNPDSELLFITDLDLDMILNEIEEQICNFRKIHIFANQTIRLKNEFNYYPLKNYLIKKGRKKNNGNYIR